MKRFILASYIEGIIDRNKGESYRSIFTYFFPEFISAFIIYSLPHIIDSLLVGSLASTASYATLGTTNNLLHLIIKLAEGVQVGTIILAGQFNGSGHYVQVGETVRDSFWVTCVLGCFVGVSLYMGAYWIYSWYGVPPEIINIGIPFLQLKSISIVFTFIYFGLIGFLRAIKNTRVPMYTLVLGSIVFIICDYVLMYGIAGFPALGLQGSGIASVIQASVMLCATVLYLLYDTSNRKYQISLFSGISNMQHIKRLCMLSLPVVIDKAVMAMAYIWLLKMLCPMGTCAMACYAYVKDMERFAFLPAIAFAQVITFLASNDMGSYNWYGIKTNIKKIAFLASLMVGTNLLFFTLYRQSIVQWFDKVGDFSLLASSVFPILSVLVFFDLVQLILSGALRGSGNVQVVMLVRVAVCVFYFFPISFVLSRLPIENIMLKFLLIYGSFYIGNALMSIAYIKFFRGSSWKLSRVKEV